jgi:hypothetical protein
MATKTPTIKQLVDIIREYNVARAQELSQKPAAGWPEGYKNPLMDSLYDAAANAGRALAMVTITGIAIEVPIRTTK